MNIKENLSTGMHNVESKVVDMLSMNMDLKNLTRTSRILSPIFAVGVAIAAFGIKPEETAAQAIVRQYDQCGGPESPGLEMYKENEDILVSEVVLPDGRVIHINDWFSIDEDCPVKGVEPRPRDTIAPISEVAVIAESCVGPLQMKSLEGRPIINVSGLPNKVTSGLDLADHAEFKSTPGLPNNVLGEPGGFLANRLQIALDEQSGKEQKGALAKWDAKVKDGMAEYQRPGVNMFDLQTTSDFGVSINSDGKPEFNLTVKPHRIIRVDFEEGDIYLKSASGDRNIHIQACQSGDGNTKGHQTVIIRTSYGQEVSLKVVSPIPGTQVQVIGDQVKFPTAFESAESFMQGVNDRQLREEYPVYIVHGINMNEGSMISAESPAPGAAFREIGKNI